MMSLDITSMIHGQVVMEEGLANVRKKYLDPGIIDPQIFHELLQADPTPQKKYSDWAFKQIYRDFKDGEGRVLPEDGGIYDTISEIAKALKAFDHGLSKGFVERKDINQYKSLRDLFTVVGDIRNKQSKTLQKREVKYEEAEKVFEDNKYLIIVPHSWKGCKIWGKDARWCIGYQDSAQYWNTYTHTDELKFYFVIDKTGDPVKDPMAKVALGVDQMNNIVEAFDALDNPIYVKGFIQDLEAQGIPKDIFNHKGWDAIANNNFNNVINDIKAEYDKTIQAQDYEHVYVDYDVYDDNEPPDMSFNYSCGIEIEIPKTVKLFKSLNNMDADTINAIKTFVAGYSAYPVDVDDDDIYSEGSSKIITIRFDLQYSNLYGREQFDDIISDMADVDSEYDEILIGVLIILAIDGYIKDRKYTEFGEISDEVQSADDANRPFRHFTNLKFEVYDDKTIGIMFRPPNVTMVKGRSSLDSKIKFDGGIKYDRAKDDYILRMVVDAIMASGGFGAETYDKNQLLFKGVLPKPSIKYNNRDKSSIKNILLESEAQVTFKTSEDDEYHEIDHIFVWVKPGMDIGLLFRYLESIDVNYPEFGANLADAVNSGLKFNLATYKRPAMGEKFNRMIDQYLNGAKCEGNL